MKTHHARSVALDRGPGKIGGELQKGRCIGQMFPPEIKLTRHLAPRQPLTLPDSVISVLNRQRRQGSGVEVASGPIKGLKLPQENADRPSI